MLCYIDTAATVATISMSDPIQLEEAVYAAAVHLPAAQRASYLGQVCGADARMRQRLETRLGPRQDDRKPVEQTASDSDTVIDQDATITCDGVLAREEMVGETIGYYTLVEKLGEGGFGSVYVAEQSEPVQRRVAFKITKLGMDTKEVVGRFKKERQALAVMDHPGIAKMLDAGATESGRPYFVMELVNGVKITDYCDQNKLSTHKRLELFIRVCRAVEHAHQKGIIHRDIKPSNILITMHDGKPAPKVIDFGIAKATQGSLADKDFTAADQFVGTPAYMSPEQADLGGLDVDTRTDIYSLGVLLYELLTAQTPLETKNLLARGFDEMRRMIKEFEPQLPSLLLGHQQKTDSTSTAKRHGTDAPKLIKMVKGDLDWVVMKCLEKDRSRRYETAGNLAADVQRFLNDEPVEARPPSKFYNFQKLVRRNKLVFTLGFAMWVALVIGLGLTTSLVLKEKEQRERAETASREANIALHKAEFSQKEAESSQKQAEQDRKKSEEERQQAEASRKKAEAALQQSEVDRAKAQAAEKKAVESEQQAQAAEKKAVDSEQAAQAARQQAEMALQQARAEHAKADTAEKKAEESLSAGQAALRAAEAAEKRVVAADIRNEAADKAAAAEADLRRKAEAAAAAALAQAGQWRGAMTNLLAGLDAVPPAEALRTVNDFFTPEDLSQPWAATFLQSRAEWHARHGDSAAAISDFSQVLKLEPNDPDLPLRLMPLLAESGGADEYRRYRLQILSHARVTNTPALALDCLLAPTSMEIASSLTALARQQSTNGESPPQQGSWPLVLSLAEYRMGHFAEAADGAAKALADATALGDAGGAQAQAVLAMAQQQLNQSDNARAALNQGQKILDTKMPKAESGDLGRQWPDWVTACQLLREAKALLPAQPAPP
jgi:serine/threonine protein kinase